MKAKVKSTKKIKKKAVAKKKVTTTKKKKSTAKPAKKTAVSKNARKGGPKKSVKSPSAKKKSVKAPRKKKAPVKAIKQSSPKNKTTPTLRPMTVIEETLVTVTTTIPGNGSPLPESTGVLVGKVVHYYNHSNVAIIALENGKLHRGDLIHIKGHTTDFEQLVESMQIEHQEIETAEEGQTVGVKVNNVAREHDRVYRKVGTS
jgi:hypothetical protein